MKLIVEDVSFSYNSHAVLSKVSFTLGKGEMTCLPILYEERFEDVDPEQKVDEIYTFLVGKPVSTKRANQ